METFVFDGEEIYVCTREEARRLWNHEPEKRGRIYLGEEYIATLPLGNADLDKLTTKKKMDPRYTYRKGDLL